MYGHLVRLFMFQLRLTSMILQTTLGTGGVKGVFGREIFLFLRMKEASSYLGIELSTGDLSMGRFQYLCQTAVTHGPV